MIRILFGLNGVFHRGGTEAVVLNIMKFIDKSQFQIELLVHGEEHECSENLIQRELIAQGIKIHRVTPRHISYASNIREIKEVLTKHQFDIVHSHMDAAGYFLLREAKKLGVKVLIAHSHSSGHHLLSSRLSLKSFLHRLVLTYSKWQLRRTANFFIGCSDLAGQWLFGDKICQSDYYMLFNNAIDLDKFSFSQDKRDQYRKLFGMDEHLVLGHIGRFDENKNHEFLLRTFGMIIANQPDAMLLLIGEGPLRNRTEDLAQELGLRSNIQFLGVRFDISELMSTMDVLILPSLQEGLPVTIVEAQANGLRIVASDTISRDAVLSDDILMLPLGLGSEAWAAEILQFAVQGQRKDNRATLRGKGYDMKANVRKLEEKYKVLFTKKSGQSKNIL